MKFILPLKISFKIQAITPCCSYEQWFSIFKKSGYLLEIKIFRNDSIKTSWSYGETLNACVSIAWMISRNVIGLVKVFAW